MNINNMNPETTFGGKWEQIQGKFLLGVDDSYVAGSTGGEKEHILTIDEMPKHKHQLITGSNPVSKDSERWNVSVWGFYDQKLDPEVSDEGTYRYVNAINYEGNSAAHNNMPPYLAVYIWKRVN